MRRLALMLCAAALVAATAQASAPRFEPQSVTFVSLRQGWALGTAAGSLALRETTDGGRTWAARPAPHVAGGRSLNVRFADPRDGWIFGGAMLWSTHDGGRSWRRLALHGLGIEHAIYDLEAARGTAWLAASNTHEGVSIRAAAVGGDGWHVVSAPRMGFPAGGGQLGGSFTFAGGAGWFVEGNDRGTTGSARLVGGRWVRWTPPCAAVGHSFAIPAASSSSDLVAVCVMGGFAFPLSPSAPPGAKLGSSWLYASSDGGASFHAVRQVREADDGPTASPAAGTILYGTFTARPRLVASFDGGRSFTVVANGEPLFVGFTSPAQGVAIVRTGSRTTSMLMSRDGGRQWAPVEF